MKRLMLSALVTVLFVWSTATAQGLRPVPTTQQVQPVQPVTGQYVYAQDSQAQSYFPTSNETGVLFGCGSCGTCPNCDVPEPWRLINLDFLGLDIGGWVEQGVTYNADNPVNRFNGVVTFNDRSNDFQLNQVWIYAERLINTDGHGLAFGGRIDVVYGTDHRFTVANGLEDNWNLGSTFYGVALPQFYVDLAINQLTFRAGHFFTLIGNEAVPALDNFFYSHSYSMQYGEPFTHTGVLAIWNPNNSWWISGGVHRGWDMFEDINDDLGYIGKVFWISPSRNTSLGVAATIGDEDPAGVNTRSMGSAVISQKFNRLTYTFQFDYGFEQNAASGGTQDAEWYGFVNTLVLEINPCFSIGGRYEWFSDDDGVRVIGPGPGPPGRITWAPIAAHWQEVTFGVNIKPHPNVLLRSEVRWDVFNPLVAFATRPFNDFSQSSQILWGTDLIISF